MILLKVGHIGHIKDIWDIVSIKTRANTQPYDQKDYFESSLEDICSQK